MTKLKDEGFFSFSIGQLYFLINILQKNTGVAKPKPVSANQQIWLIASPQERNFSLEFLPWAKNLFKGLSSFLMHKGCVFSIGQSSLAS